MPWDPPPERIRELLRQGAELAIQQQSDWLDDFTTSFLGSPGMETNVSDPVLATESARAARAIVTRWAVSNISDPGVPVTPALDTDIIGLSRDLVRRGLDEVTLTSFRIGQTTAWTSWIRIAFTLTSELDEIQALLDLSARSIAEFVEGTLTLVTERMQVEREELRRGTHPERREALALLLEGAPIPRERAEMRLGYSLGQTHTGAIVWSTEPDSELSHLERVVELLASSACRQQPFVIVAGTATIWVWLPGDVTLDAQQLTQHISSVPDVRVAVGSAGSGPEGFRRTHMEAVLTQQMLSRLGARQHVATFDDVRLVTLLAADGGDQFVHHMLGRLANADVSTRDTVLTFVRELGSVARTAARLHAHRNTIVRRLRVAEQLLPRPLNENPVHVAVALELIYWQGG